MLTMALRTVALSFRLSPDEQAMLAKLAAVDGVTTAGMIRVLVRREWATRYGAETKPPKPRAPRKPKPSP